jgi:hypothetical protein
MLLFIAQNQMVRENKNDGENISSRISRRKEMVNIDA